MTAQKFIAKLVSRRKLARDTFEVIFKVIKPIDFTYKVGNFASIRVDDGKIPLVFRAYTFASVPNKNGSFKLIVKLFCDKEGNKGRGSGFLQSLEINKTVEFFGPAGTENFTPRGAINEPLLLLGTGTGIAPLVATAEKLTTEKSPRPIKLFLGVSFIEDVFYREEFEQLKKANPNFNFLIAISRPPRGYVGITGRLPTILEKEKNLKNSEAFICGSITSVAGIKTKLLELGLSKDKIDAEGFGEN